MHHAVDAVFFKCLLQCTLVADVAANDRNRAPGDFLYSPNGFWMAVAEVVKDHDFMAVAEQFDGGVAADITGAACEQSFHGK